jgi:hypothetical protein
MFNKLNELEITVAEKSPETSDFYYVLTRLIVREDFVTNESLHRVPSCVSVLVLYFVCELHCYIAGCDILVPE